MIGINSCSIIISVVYLPRTQFQKVLTIIFNKNKRGTYKYRVSFKGKDTIWDKYESFNSSER